MRNFRNFVNTKFSIPGNHSATFTGAGETIAAGTIVGVAGQKQLDTSPTLTNSVISQPDDLDMADDPMLDIQEYKSNKNWNTDSCTTNGVNITLPESNSTSLYYMIDTSCYRLDACVEVPIPGYNFSKSLKAYLELDPCSLVMRAGFETKQQTYIMVNYEWGRSMEIYELSLLFSVSKSSTGFTVDLTLKICFPDSDVSYCVPSTDGIPLVRNQFFPFCLKNDTDLKNFSLSGWGNALGIVTSEPTLQTDLAGLLMQQIGLDTQLIDPACDRSNAVYSPSTEGWKNDCPTSVADPTGLSGDGIHASCSISSSCSTVDCCYDFTYLGRTLHFYVNIDTCNYVIRGAIEKLTFEYHFFTYNWDCPATLTLPTISNTVTCHIPDYCTGVTCCVEAPLIGRSFLVSALIDGCNMKLNLGIEKRTVTVSLIGYSWGSFTVDDLSAENQYLLTVNTSVCFEANSACNLSVLLLEDMRLPKLPCDQQTTVVQQNCGESIGTITTLSGPISCNVPTQCSAVSCCVNIDFLQRSFHASVDIDPCDKKFMISIDDLQLDLCYLKYQWDCVLDVTTVTIPLSTTSSTTCVVKDICSAVDCCTEVDFLNRPFNTFLYIDPCDLTFIIGIEKLVFNASLTSDPNFEFGKFTITEQPLQYVIDLDMSVCFEYGGACYFTMTVFKDTILPKQFCTNGTTFIDSEFILQGWLGETYVNKDTLDPYVVNELMRDLHLIDYLLEPQCDVSTAPYTPVNAQGWNISPECTSAPTLPTLTSEVTCNLGDSCTSIKCCVTSVKLGRTFTIDLDLDVCNQTFMVGVDRLTRTVALASFVFSQEDVFSFDGLINVKYESKSCCFLFSL
ncbi:unnamed protein product [Mytilus coruscus]|uniref:Uncharacterized protein n=1 Tax=Mytilus coruscus TaxID=42192 RepID=A0A6J8B694_MYTCO|nr:unnamed protein product [Mytilus coruscus]